MFLAIFCTLIYTLPTKALPLPFAILLKEPLKSIHQFLLIQMMQIIEEPPLNLPMRSLNFIFSQKTIKGNCAVLPKRRVVEHTFSWLNHSRRLAKGLETLKWTSENMIQIAMIRITQCKMRMMLCQTVFNADTITFKPLDRFFLYCHDLGLIP